MRDCGEEELEAIQQSRQEFSRAKAALTRNTAYGLPYSPHYFQASRARNAPVRETAPEMTATLEPVSDPPAAEPPRQAAPARSGMEALPVRLAPSARKIGRNEPCPCGSGRKYKKCHGEND